MSRRETAVDDPSTVHVWVSRLRGTTRGVAVFAHETAARAWVEDVLDDGTWNDGEQKHRFDAGPDTAIVEAVPVQGAAALLTIDPPAQ